MKKTQRQIVEEKFHDTYAASMDLKDVNIRENFSFAAQENRMARNTFGNLKGKKVLDLGCGFGETAVYWALKGADVEAIDISSKSIALAKKLAAKNKVWKNCKFQTMTAENLKFKDQYFDYVFGNGVLHHVDLNKAAKEIYRVLKPGGKGIFVEPLAYNPIINIYRIIADTVRTPMEKPLTFKQIDSMAKFFTTVAHREYECLTLIIFVWFFIVARISPNEERYWRKILTLRGSQKAVLKVLINLDKILLKLLPPAKYFCWNTVVEVVK